MKFWLPRVCIALAVVGVLYLPVRREILDAGLIPACRFTSDKGDGLTLFSNGKYLLRHDGRERPGTFGTERFPDAPWISLVRLDTGLTLHVRYDDRVYRVEDISRLAGADVRFVRR